MTDVLEFVLHKDWGSFHYPEVFCEQYGVHRYDAEDHCEERFIEWVKAHPDESEGHRIVTIPATATDCFVNDYDGMESLIYVVNGKLNWA